MSLRVNLSVVTVVDGDVSAHLRRGSQVTTVTAGPLFRSPSPWPELTSRLVVCLPQQPSVTNPRPLQLCVHRKNAHFVFSVLFDRHETSTNSWGPACLSAVAWARPLTFITTLFLCESVPKKNGAKVWQMCNVACWLQICGLFQEMWHELKSLLCVFFFFNWTVTVADYISRAESQSRQISKDGKKSKDVVST